MRLNFLNLRYCLSLLSIVGILIFLTTVCEYGTKHIKLQELSFGKHVSNYIPVLPISLVENRIYQLSPLGVKEYSKDLHTICNPTNPQGKVGLSLSYNSKKL